MKECETCSRGTKNKRFCSNSCYRESLIGKPSPAKGMKFGPPSEAKRKAISEALKGHRLSEETKRKMSESRKGRVMAREAVERTRQANLGSRRTLESRQKMSEAQKARFQRESPWNKGIGSFAPYTPEFTNELRDYIRERDGWTCRICGKHQREEVRKLQVHHIDYDKSHSCPDNLVALCMRCHSDTTNGDRGYWSEFFSVTQLSTVTRYVEQPRLPIDSA